MDRTIDARATVRPLKPEDLPVIEAGFAGMGWADRRYLLERYLAEQERGERMVFVALMGRGVAGYLTVKWQSDYPPFAQAAIPEITDLNVLPLFRRRGIASLLMDEAERLIFERFPAAGIAVGLFSDYGPAQRMYARRGYVPDGLGLSYAGRHVRPYRWARVDDGLALYLTKERRISRRSGPPEEQATRTWFNSLRIELETAYLAHAEPWKQSGLVIDDERAWTACRKPIADCIEMSGSFLDIGCANGYLLETVLAWTRERGLDITPYGIDLSRRLVALARKRLNRYRRNFYVGNALYWNSPPRFDYVHSELIYVPEALRRRYVERLIDSYLKADGKLLLTEYRSRKAPSGQPWMNADLAEWGIPVQKETSGFYDAKEVTRVMVVANSRGLQIGP